jgi:uncharacterized membrane protein YraQ (UPF0718 family)
MSTEACPVPQRSAADARRSSALSFDFWRNEWKAILSILVVFLGAFYLPVGSGRFDNAILEAFHLLQWYAREHVLLCLVPAFFIAGAIGVFVSQASVIRYLGARANKALAYGVASVSGTILAVCSCTVLPLFAGIYRMGAGLGPASAFLYSGPAVNVLAIVLTARVLGLQLGVARAVGAIVFSVVIGLFMHLIFRREEKEKVDAQMAMPEPEATRPLWQTSVYFASMVAVLVFANWGRPAGAAGLFAAVHSVKWVLTGASAALLGLLLAQWFGLAWVRLAAVAAPTILAAVLFPDRIVAFMIGSLGLAVATSTDRGPMRRWFEASWGFAKQILPLLFVGILVSGVLLGRPGHEGLIPSQWVAALVGGNSLWANLFASVVAAFMYFATLTEVPILLGLIGSGMGQGPALALLLAGPALSLPSMLVLRSVMGTRKTAVFVGLVIVLSTVSGMLYGRLVG